MYLKCTGTRPRICSAHSSHFTAASVFKIGFLWIFWVQKSLVFATLMQDLVILDELLTGYDRRATPTNHLNNTTATKVYCELFVRSFGTPNPLTMDYKVDLYLRQKWRDERLKHKDLRQPLDLNDPNLVKAIWKPEVYFPNAKEADFQFVTVPNVLVRINPDGEILYMLRLRVTFSCMMDLSKFPLDRQMCTMEVASFSKTMDELILQWSPENPVTTGSFGMSQFELDEITTQPCPSTVSFGQIGNYSCIIAAFHLSRSLGYHLVQSYLPTILMVVISWVSFWMDVNSVPGRVTLGITTLLTVSHKSTNIQENLPQSSYVKAIDVWMGTCTGFVFLALLEFTVVNYLWRKENHRYGFSGGRRNSRRLSGRDYNMYQHSSEVDGCENSPTGTAVGNTLIHLKEKADKNSTPGTNHMEARFIPSSRSNSVAAGLELPALSIEAGSNNGGRKGFDQIESKLKNKIPIRATTIDEICRIVFPLAFATFNCVYWPYYLLF